MSLKEKFNSYINISIVFQNRIVGGQETKMNEYPMMVGIIENAIESIHCGGVIIATRYVMTAAHCVNSYRNNPGALSVTAGDHYIDDSKLFILLIYNTS